MDHIERLKFLRSIDHALCKFAITAKPVKFFSEFVIRWWSVLTDHGTQGQWILSNAGTSFVLCFFCTRNKRPKNCNSWPLLVLDDTISFGMRVARPWKGKFGWTMRVLAEFQRFGPSIITKINSTMLKTRITSLIKQLSHIKLLNGLMAYICVEQQFHKRSTHRVFVSNWMRAHFGSKYLMNDGNQCSEMCANPKCMK